MDPVNDSDDAREERNVNVRVILQQGPRGETVKALLQEYEGSERIIAISGSHLLLLAEAIDDAFTSAQGKRGETRIELVLSSKEGSSPTIRVGWFTVDECKRIDAEEAT
jgi:tRNA pseudouridine-54 N-methylase